MQRRRDPSRPRDSWPIDSCSHSRSHAQRPPVCPPLSRLPHFLRPQPIHRTVLTSGRRSPTLWKRVSDFSFFLFPHPNGWVSRSQSDATTFRCSLSLGRSGETQSFRFVSCSPRASTPALHNQRVRSGANAESALACPALPLFCDTTPLHLSPLPGLQQESRGRRSSHFSNTLLTSVGSGRQNR